MAKRIRFIAERYSETAYVHGVYDHGFQMEEALYNHIKEYYEEHYRSVFFAGNEKKKDIFQEAFITLWQIIEDRRIYVENGVLKGRKSKPLASSLFTFFMGVARLKNLEYSREHPWDSSVDAEELEREVFEVIYGGEEDKDDTDLQFRIVSECLSQMPPRCNQIITKFYYEEKSLDTIMVELNTFLSKNALKTAKYKCMETLRNSAKAMYDRYLSA